MFYGGSPPYRNAIVEALESVPASYEHEPVKLTVQRLGVALCVVFVDGPETWEILHSEVGDPDTYWIAVIHGLSIGDMAAALGCGARGVLFEDNPIEHFVAVCAAALRHDLLIPSSIWSPRRDVSLPAGLSTASRRILTLMAEGKSNKEIGASLHLSERTVARRVTSLYLFLGVKRRREAIEKWDLMQQA